MKREKKAPKNKRAKKTATARVFTRTRSNDVMMATPSPGGAIKDGRLEVVTAIAEVSELVTVDPSTDPFTTVPPNLFSLQFNDEHVGIDDEQMQDFKGRLSILLPEISDPIKGIPEDANQIIRSVARIVRLALAAAD